MNFSPNKPLHTKANAKDFEAFLDEAFQARLTKHRQTLHQCPELGFDCVQTSHYVDHVLRPLGYQMTSVAQTGWLAYKEGLSKKTLVFRADMDALPIQEATGVPYASKHPGVMHACGHDGHMAMLLGLGEILAQTALEWSVLLVFEPAEETLGGAQYIVSDPSYQKHDIEAVYALHLDPTLPFGTCGFCPGIMTAQDADLDITIQGQSAHGTTPAEGKSALLAASQLALALSQLTRLTGQLEDQLATVGTLHSGEGRNIIASYATLQGTLRAFKSPTFEALKDAVFDQAQAIEKAYGVAVHTSIQTLHPPVYNDTRLCLALKQCLPNTTLIAPRLIAEDFSYFQHHAPGVLMMLGTQDAQYPDEQLHRATFNYHDTILSEGVKTYLRIIQHHLKERAL